MRRFTDSFSAFPKFREHFAVKAMPNPYMLKILAEEGCGADCSSLPELMLSDLAGIEGESVIFTSNETPASEFQYAYEHGNLINLDDITHIDFLKNVLGGKLPKLLCFRYNPGPLKQGGNAIIGKPEEAKYGLTREQLFEAYARCKAAGVERFGLHTMVASNELNPDFFIERRRTVVLVERVFQEISNGIYEGDIVKVNGVQGTVRLNSGILYLDAKNSLCQLKSIEGVEVIGNVMEGVKLTA